jgi:2-polyprenyl-3-methyl-5-hydroxy-6-metoxy-1,4-benzoquinol methylase
MSIGYYDQNSDTFFRETVEADMRELRARFLAHVPAGGRILDAGCGSGRDALAFQRQGYTVEAFDGSAEMVRLARAHTGLPVRHLLFEEVDWTETFDGVWACASLLHVPRAHLPDTIERFVRTLRQRGVLFVSFKRGQLEREVYGRHFTDLTEGDLRQLLAATRLEALDVWISRDVRSGRDDKLWISGIGKRVE